MSEIIKFVIVVASHWQGYVTGGVVTGLIYTIERLSNWKMPRRMFAALSLGVFLLVSFFLAWRDQYREALQVPVLKAQVEDRDKQISSLRDRPAQIQVNVPSPTINFPPQMAYLSSTDSVGLVADSYKFGGHMAVNYGCKNLSTTVIAENGLCQAGIRVAEAKPSPLKMPFVAPSVQEKLYRDFQKDLTAFSPRRRTYAQGQSDFDTVWTPEIDDDLDKSFREGSKTIVFLAKNTWKDDSGWHESEQCQFLQFEPRLFSGPGRLIPNAQVVWHYCDKHNGLVK